MVQRVQGTFGYARLITADQNPDLRPETLSKVLCDRDFMDRKSSSIADRDDAMRL